MEAGCTGAWDSSGSSRGGPAFLESKVSSERHDRNVKTSQWVRMQRTAGSISIIPLCISARNGSGLGMLRRCWFGRLEHLTRGDGL